MIMVLHPPEECIWCKSKTLEKFYARDMFVRGKTKYRVRIWYKFCRKCKSIQLKENYGYSLGWERVKK